MKSRTLKKGRGMLVKMIRFYAAYAAQDLMVMASHPMGPVIHCGQTLKFRQDLDKAA